MLRRRSLQARFLVALWVAGALSGCDLIDALVQGNPQPPAPPPTKEFVFHYSIAASGASGSYLVPGAGSAETCTAGPLPPTQIAQMVQARNAQWNALKGCADRFAADLANVNTDVGFPDLLDSNNQPIGERLKFEVFGPRGGPIDAVRAETFVDVTHRNRVTQGTITIEFGDGRTFVCARPDAHNPWHLNANASDQFFEMELDGRDPQANELWANFQCLASETTPGIASPALLLVMEGDVFMDY